LSPSAATQPLSTATSSSAARPQPTPTVSSSNKPDKDLAVEHSRLGELLLQALLRIDILPMDPTWPDARAERKRAVKTVQGLLDRLDGGWAARDGADVED